MLRIKSWLQFLSDCMISVRLSDCEMSGESLHNNVNIKRLIKAETRHQLASSICSSDVVKKQQSHTSFPFVSPPLFWFVCAMKVLRRTSLLSF